MVINEYSNKFTGITGREELTTHDECVRTGDYFYPKVDEILSNQTEKNGKLYHSYLDTLVKAYSKHNTCEEIIKLGEELEKIALELKGMINENSISSYQDESTITSKMKKVKNVNDKHTEIFDIEKIEHKDLLCILDGLYIEARVIISTLIESKLLIKWQQIDFFGKELYYIGTKINFINAYLGIKNNGDSKES